MTPVLVFDMDGVLVDVSESYRETIVQTVRHFTGQAIRRELIQDYKNQGGWNNDWALSQRIIADVGGQDIEYQTVVGVFQSYFFGPDNDGLILRERWLPAKGLLQRLADSHALCIFTGRLRYEAAFTLNRFVPDLQWSSIVADDDVKNSKPAPDGLQDIERIHAPCTITYFGDTVDDARSASAAGVRFIGVAGPENPKRQELIGLLHAEGALSVIESVNQIEEVL